jgi:aspartyl-tRNA synthetase
MTPDHLATTHRTHLCGALRTANAGQHVRLGGWVHRSRDLGGLAFVDLRDRGGIVQVSFDPRSCSPDVCAAAAALGPETVVLVEGEVVARPEAMRNPELATGDIEVRANALKIVGPATPPAIPVARARNENLAAEEIRLRHRFLDLRRTELQDNIILRHRLMQVTRRYLSERSFIEVETPILTKPTPEGARDYLVPSRVHPGEFYALPQSPQLYKQLLMVAGFDRYFQIARCFRDEDLRQDRQPEFTQIDIEASFVGADDIMTMSEGLIRALWQEAGVSVPDPIPRLTYADCMERFGSDRPDTRYGLEIFDASEVFRGADFGITRAALEQGGRVRGIRVPGGGVLSRKQQEEIEAEAKKAGALGLLRLKMTNGVLEGPVAKFLAEGSAARLTLQDGDLALLVAGPDHVSSPAVDRVRQEDARRMNMGAESESRFLWVTEFPMFE